VQISECANWDSRKIIVEVEGSKNSNPVVSRSFELALDVVEFVWMVRDVKEYDLASQIFRSGTSIGANIRESQGAESRADFVHKLKIAAKEAEELEYWLDLCRASPRLITPPEELKGKLIEVKKLLSSIIASSKKNH